MIRFRWQAFPARRLRPASGPRAPLGLVSALVALAHSAGCGDESGTGPTTDWDAIDPVVYSEHVQAAFDLNCNTAFCHNREDRAAGLSLVSYGDLAEGSRFGTVVVPFDPGFSMVWLHTAGEVLPRMPLGREPLPDGQIRLIRRWIADGARFDDGIPMYSDVTRKAFVACQGENVVSVVDMDTGLLVRNLPVDKPHSVYVDVPARRVYVSRFETASDNIHVYDAETYELLATGRAGTFPAMMEITPDRSQLWVTNFDATSGPTADHAVRVLDPDTLEEIASFELPFLRQPHGLAIDASGTFVWITGILTDNVAIFETRDGITGEPDFVDFVDLPGIASPEGHQPQQCVLGAAEDYLYVSALKSNRVYTLDTATLQWVGEVEVGEEPWHLTLRPGGGELWVANWVGNSVSVLDLGNPSSPQRSGDPLAPSHPVDPHHPALVRPIGIAFSPDGTQVWVTNANDTNEGSGHHPPPEGEKNPGGVVVFDATSREVLTVTEVPNFARFVSFLP